MREEHDLLLVHGDTVRFGKVFLHVGQVVCDFFLAVLAPYERRYVFHRSRTVKGVHGYKVREHGRTQFAQIFLHAWRFVLEHAYRIAALEQLVCLRVVYRYLVGIYTYAETRFDEVYRVVYQGKSLKAEKVHFQQAGGLDHFVVELRDEHFRVFGRSHRYVLAYVRRSYYDAAGMYAQALYRAFDDFGLVYYPGSGVATLGQFLESVRLVYLFLFVFQFVAKVRFGQFEQFCEAHIGDFLSQFVHFGRREA